MNVAEMVAQERRGVDAEFEMDSIAAPLIAVMEPNDLIELRGYQLRTTAPIDVVPLGGRTKALVQSCPKLNYKSLWVLADRNDYASDYLKFLREHHVYQGDSIPSQYHVDHIFNQDRGKSMGFRYLRTALLEGPINRAYGAGYERLLSANQGSRFNRGSRKMDLVTYMKFRGVPAPSVTGSLLAVHLDCIRNFSRITHTDLAQNIKAVEELLALARVRWAPKNTV